MQAEHVFIYSDTVTSPQGTQNQRITVHLRPNDDGSATATISVVGKPDQTFTVSPGEADRPTPQPSPAPPAEAQLFADRLRFALGLMKQMMQGQPASARVPVLVPGASAPLDLPVSFAKDDGGTWKGHATLSTTATITPQNVKHHSAFTPVGLLANSIRESEEKKPRQMPDDLAADVNIVPAGQAFKVEGTTTQLLHSPKGNVTLTERWSFAPDAAAPQ